jgi:hypothetical protein
MALCGSASSFPVSSSEIVNAGFLERALKISHEAWFHRRHV